MYVCFSCLVGVVLLVKDCRMINLIMEYLVKDRKRCALWSLNEDILEITILKTNTPYPSRKLPTKLCQSLRPKTPLFPVRIRIKTDIDRRLSISEEALGAFGKSQTYRAEDRYRGRRYDRGQEADQKQVKIMNDRRDKVQEEYHVDKEVNQAARDSDDALVCCIENTVEDRIMDFGALFHATCCKEKLERFKLRSGKVCLADNKTLDIAGIRDFVLKTSFGTSWTLKDVRYILGLKIRLISVGQLDEEGYHVGFGDQQWKVTKGNLVVARGNKHGSLYMVEDWWFGKAEEAFLCNVREDKKTAETAAGVAFGVAERLNRTLRAESTGLRAEAPKMLHIPEEEWRGKDTSLTHLKVFGCDSFVKVKDVCGEAMKCTFIGIGSDKMRYSFRDTKSHQVMQSRDITFVDLIYGARSVTDSSSLTKPIQKSHVVLVDIPKNLAENDSIVAEHGLSSEITQSPGGSSDTKPDMFLSQITSRKVGITKLVDVQGLRRAGWQEKLAGQKENLKCILKEIQYGLIQAPRQWVLIFVEDSWNEEPCRDVHQVGDEREVEVLRSFNWPPSELITEDGFLPERGYSQFNDVSSGYLDTLYRKSPSPAFGWCSVFRMFGGTESLARVVQFGTGRAVWHDRAVWNELKQFSSELNNILWFDPVDCHDYPSRGYHEVYTVQSNSFEVLNVDSSIIEEVATGSKVTTSGTQEEGQCTVHLVEKINVIEKHILEGKLVLVDDDGKPLVKVDYPVNSDDDDTVEPVENKTTSIGIKGSWIWSKKFMGTMERNSSG
ncbi:retrovirus-related pol polyprotein from transposon TNT 1-94 [Tanacetum coccineum]